MPSNSHFIVHHPCCTLSYVAVTNTKQFHQAEKTASLIRNVQGSLQTSLTQHLFCLFMWFPVLAQQKASQHGRRFTKPRLTLTHPDNRAWLRIEGRHMNYTNTSPYSQGHPQVVGQEQVQLLVRRLRRRYREVTRANCN